MTFQTPPVRRHMTCDDAPVSYQETPADVAAQTARAARLARSQVTPPAAGHRWDEREIARSALGDLPEGPRAEFLAELLCELRGPKAREALARARNRITTHLHELITAEYDAEAATMPGQDVAVLARSTTVVDEMERCGLMPVEFDLRGRCIAWQHPSGALVDRRFLPIVDWRRSTDRELFFGGSEPPEGRARATLQAYVDAIRTAEEATRDPAHPEGGYQRPGHSSPEWRGGAAASAGPTVCQDRAAMPEGIAE